jgi:protein TonB
MSPRSLLFSSDQETSRAVSQALNELELDVEHCSEIFAALKRLTIRSFDLVVVDWDEGLEAGFLLKTSRELSSNSAAFALVLARGEPGAVARQSGASLVLAKPMLPEQVQFALLGCDEFLRRLKTWLPPRNVHGTTVHIGEKGAVFAPVPQPPPPQPVSGRFPAAPAVAGNRVASGGRATLTLATLGQASFPQSVFRKLIGWRAAAGVRPSRIRQRDSAFLRRAAIVVVFFSVGYVFSQPFSRVAASVAKIYENSWSKKPGTLRVAQNKNNEMAQATEAIPGDDPEPQHARRRSSGKIRVIPVDDPLDPRPRRPASRSQEQVQAPAPRSPEPPSAAVAGAAARPKIPESLRTPSSVDATVRSIAASFSPSLLSAFEPVILPEYLAEKLLLAKVQPSYPEQALRAGLQGPVVLQAWIGRDGKITDLKLVRGSLLLGQAACKAVKQWRYQPYLLNGEAVEAQTYVTVDFRLP